MNVVIEYDRDQIRSKKFVYSKLNRLDAICRLTDIIDMDYIQMSIIDGELYFSSHDQMIGTISNRDHLGNFIGIPIPIKFKKKLIEKYGYDVDCYTNFDWENAVFYYTLRSDVKEDFMEGFYL